MLTGRQTRAGGFGTAFSNPFASAGPGTLQRNYYEDNPGGAYNLGLGLGYGQNAQAQFMRGLFPEFYQSYQGVLPQRGAEFSFVDYLQEQTPQLQRQWADQPSRARGYDYSSAAPRVRYLL